MNMPTQPATTPLHLSFRVPLFGARNLLLRDFEQRQIPRCVWNDKGKKCLGHSQ
jgi:hypothetical protein